MIDALWFLTNKPLSTENNADKNDEISAYTIPRAY